MPANGVLPEGSPMAISKTLDVNGARITTSFDDPDMPLFYLLRDNLGLHGPRFGKQLRQSVSISRSRFFRSVLMCRSLSCPSAVEAFRSLCLSRENFGTSNWGSSKTLRPTRYEYARARARRSSNRGLGRCAKCAHPIPTHRRPIHSPTHIIFLGALGFTAASRI
jgi:hypothetical protein